jgi:hypothetical protein
VANSPIGPSEPHIFRYFQPVNPVNQERFMRNFNHFVATNHATTGLNYVMPFMGNRDLQANPQRMVQWGCAGPCLIAWGRSIVPQKALPDELFSPLRPIAKLDRPIGHWFKQRRSRP